MTDLNIMAQQFYADGFVILRQVYSPDEIANLEQQLEDFVHRMVPSLQPGQVYFEDTPSRPIKAIHRLESHSDYFQQIMTDPRILEVVQAIFPGSPILPEAVMFFAKQAGSGPVTP